MSSFKILIIISTALGDFINFLPFLQHILINYPNGKITLITPKKYFEIFNYTEFRIHNLIDYNSFPIYKLYSKKLDIDKTLLSLKSFDLIISFTGAKNNYFKKNLLKINNNSHFIFPIKKDGNLHESFYLTLNFPFNKRYLFFPKLILPESNKEYVAIHPGSGNKKKNVNINFILNLSKYIDLPVKFFGGENEIDLKNVLEIEICENIKSAVNILKKAFFYIGNDSGISHLAAAFNIPSFIFFGPTSIKVWKPLGENCLVITKNMNCSPCDFTCNKKFQCLSFDPKIIGELILNIYKNFFN